MDPPIPALREDRLMLSSMRFDSASVLPMGNQLNGAALFICRRQPGLQARVGDLSLYDSYIILPGDLPSLLPGFSIWRVLTHLRSPCETSLSESDWEKKCPLTNHGRDTIRASSLMMASNGSGKKLFQQICPVEILSLSTSPLGTRRESYQRVGRRRPRTRLLSLILSLRKTLSS
jgi:hypothetical protein